MKRRISTFFLVIPVLFVLLHAFTPHHHLLSPGNTPEIGPAHTCPSGLLSDLFNFSPGENHLEEYQVFHTDFDFPVELTAYLEFFRPEVPVRNTGLFILPSFLWAQAYFRSTISRRGPPSTMS